MLLQQVLDQLRLLSPGVNLGHKDLESLHQIYEQTKSWCKKNKSNFNFKVDDGDYETAIEFFFLGDAKVPQWEVLHPPRSKNWDTNPTIFCPDLLDYTHKIIIEYEEEGEKLRTGARLATKGHGPEGNIPTTKDFRRESYYKFGRFRVLRFYETDLQTQNWEKLYSFLVNCVEKPSI